MFIDNRIKIWDMEYKIGNQFLNCMASNSYTIYSLECARNMNVFDDKCANDIVIRNGNLSNLVSVINLIPK